MKRTFPQGSAARCPPLRHRVTVESLEHRVLMASDVRSIDGTGNSLTNPAWGSAGSALLRLAGAAYADGVSSPAGADRPSARAISNAVAAVEPDGEEVLSAANLAAFAYLWGQFIDHDVGLTTAAAPAEPFNVPVPAGDPQFDPRGTGSQVIRLNRSEYAAGTGVTSPRQQVNEITAFMDGSMVYGSDPARAAALRSFAGGRLLTSEGGLLPFNTGGLPNDNNTRAFPDDELFLAGDVRANENIELTAVHTLFVREHNRQAARTAAADPALSDEQVYQRARRLVVAEIQAITYNEFLPAVLGRNPLRRYAGYDPGVNPGVSNEFSAAAFRLGHSMLADDVEFFDNEGEEVREEMPLAEAFFNPLAVEEAGIDPILKYLASSNAMEVDNVIVDGVRNFLFGPPGAGGLDLASLNIQRGRDHGLADYNTTRAALGLAPVTGFSEITSDPGLAAELQSLYDSVDNVDLWVGGLAEDHARGSNLGPTFHHILVDQFTRLRAGDRFWYERDLTPAERAMVGKMTLARVISANTGISNLQANVFVFDVEIGGRLWDDADADGRQDRGEGGVSGVSLSLADEDGDTVGTATTGRDGTYRFSGVQIGDFVVSPTLRAGQRLTTAPTAAVDVTRGQRIAGVDFGVRTAPKFPPPPAAAAPHDTNGAAMTRADLADLLA